MPLSKPFQNTSSITPRQSQQDPPFVTPPLASVSHSLDFSSSTSNDESSLSSFDSEKITPIPKSVASNRRASVQMLLSPFARQTNIRLVPNGHTDDALVNESEKERFENNLYYGYGDAGEVENEPEFLRDDIKERLEPTQAQEEAYVKQSSGNHNDVTIKGQISQNELKIGEVTDNNVGKSQSADVENMPNGYLAPHPPGAISEKKGMSSLSPLPIVTVQAFPYGHSVIPS